MVKPLNFAKWFRTSPKARKYLAKVDKGTQKRAWLEYDKLLAHYKGDMSKYAKDTASVKLAATQGQLIRELKISFALKKIDPAIRIGQGLFVAMLGDFINAVVKEIMAKPIPEPQPIKHKRLTTRLFEKRPNPGGF